MLFILLLMGFFIAKEFWDVCITESRGKMLNISGHNFEISETNCDFIAKEDHINVLASKPGQTKQTPIFVYSPGRDPMPVIRSTGPHSIRISIADISSEILRMNNWEGLSIEYDIGEITYPSQTAETAK